MHPAHRVIRSLGGWSAGVAGGVGTDGPAGTDGVAMPDGPPIGPVTGSGTPTTRHVLAGGVTVLVVEAGFSVHVTIGGGSERATVRMDDNLTDLVEIRVDGNRLRLGLAPRSQVRGATLSAELTVRYLNQITAGGGSTVSFSSVLVGDQLVLTALGMSEIKGAICVTRVQAGVSGASRLALSGQVTSFGVAASGASELLLAELAVTDLDARLSGASVAEVLVEDTLAVEASGASALRYDGNPQITRLQSIGASSVAPVG